jgi:hydroxyacylglutathione hydrolase
MKINPIRNSDATSNHSRIISNSSLVLERRSISNGVKKIIIGPLSTNCYLVSSGKQSVLIDPGEEADRIIKEVNSLKTELKYIILTHYHFDHVLAAQEIKTKTGAKILIHQADKDFLEFEADQYLKDGDKIGFGNDVLKVIHTPGHTKGSICLLGENEVFVGDLIFEDGYGRTDLAGGSEKEIKDSFLKINNIFGSNKDLICFSGHGEDFYFKNHFINNNL